MDESKISGIEKMFQMFVSAAMRPRKYEKKPLPERVTVLLDPNVMEILQVISDRIGASRANAAHQILTIGVYEAAKGCGFNIDEDGNIPEEEKKWDLSRKKQGFGFFNENEEEK